jgi:hypothetical protein
LISTDICSAHKIYGIVVYSATSTYIVVIEIKVELDYIANAKQMKQDNLMSMKMER